MQEASKQNRLGNTWKTITKTLSKGWRSLNNAMLRYAYKRASKKQMIVGLEPEATERIFVNALTCPEFIVRFLEQRPPFDQPGRLWVHNAWKDILANPDPQVLEQLQKTLANNTDALSHEVIDRFIARYQYCQDFAGEAYWQLLAAARHRDFPLDYQAQKQIFSLARQYHCPYTIPKGFLVLNHMASHFGLKLLPLEVQSSLAGRDIIDGGGCTGDSAMVFTEYHPRQVYAFEPNPDTIPAMKQVIEENADALGQYKDRIEVVPLAIAKSKGRLSFCSCGVFDITATTLDRNDRERTTYEVETISIDEFVQTRSLNVGLIKLDIEGAEYDAILGAKETIMTQKPVLLISIYHTAKDFFEIKPLIESWGGNYQFAVRDLHPPDSDAEFVLMGY